MLINTIKKYNDVRTNICIIGSGIGGGSIAKKLSELNKDFIIVEAGNLKGDSDIIQKSHTGRSFGFCRTTSIQLGGTSNLWHGVLSPLDEVDFKKRDWIPHSGWPITLNDLLPHYLEAAEILGLNHFENFFEETLSSNLKHKLTEIEFNRNYLKNKLFQQALPCVNFKDIIKELTQFSEKQHCYYNAAALELLTTESGNQIEKLLVGTKEKKYFSIQADIFIIAAGALETPRLLLNSNKTVAAGLGNKFDNVGRYLADHPMGNLCQLKFIKPQKAHIYSDYKYTSSIKIKSGLELTERFQEELKLPNHNFFLRPSFIKGINNESEKVKLSLLSFKDGQCTFSDFFRVISNLNVIRQILAYKLSLDVEFSYADLFFMTEQLPNPNSRVLLSPIKDRFDYPIAEINWQLLPEDIAGMQKYFNLLLTKLFPKDYYRFTYTADDFDWENILTSAIHHSGTARMANSEKNGVVDKNQKVFGLDNLYISDGSIFTTSGNVNTGLTTSAFACRLANFLLTNKLI